MKKSIHHIIAFLIITILVGFLAWTNQVPGTMLAGWDDLHHEFNFQLALSRTIQGVWRADQGLGAVAGHSHMSDLPRIIILWIISLVEPIQNIRFVFVILSLFVGALGMYVFVYTLFIQIIRSRSIREQRDPSALVGITKESDDKIFITRHFDSSPLARVEKSLSSVSAVALISTFVYVLNLGTVQQFILPFEMFMVQFAVLPWLILSAALYLQKPTPQRLIIFAMVTLLFSPVAYAATLWYVFFGIFIAWLMLQKMNFRGKHFLILIVVFTTMNLYWILPNIYFVKYHGEEVRTSKINTIFSPDMFEANKQFGNIKDALLLKSFLFDWQMYDYDTHTFPQIMDTWRKHLENPLALATGYLITFMGIGGIIFAIKQKDRRALPYAVFYILPIILILNGTWPISAVYEQLSTISPLIKEALRTPFTKVSIPAGFGLALFVGYFVLQLHTVGKQIFRFGVIVVIASILYFALPAFNGAYIHQLVQVKIPSAYFEMFEYFNTQPKHTRVALLPIHTFWNWTYYTWGYQGAGFLQFGIPQPLLDRDYGRWSMYNEQYVREMSYALYSQNPAILGEIIRKFDIEFIVLDTSVFEPSLPTQHSLLNWISPAYLEETQLFEYPLRFGDNLLVYKRKLQWDGDSYLTKTIPKVVPVTMRNSPLDPIYITQGDYYTNETNGQEHFLAQEDALNSRIVRKYHVDLPNIAQKWAYCADNTNTQSGRDVQADGIRFISVDTNICETFVFPELPHDTSYILVLKSTNLTGRPLTFCVKNLLTGHCDLSEQLRYGTNDVTEYFDLPRLWDYGLGYQVEVANIARGRGKSENMLKNLEMWEVDDPIAGGRSVPTVMPADVRYENNYLREIRIDTAKLSGQDPILVLDQAYEEGWIAIELQNSQPEADPPLADNSQFSMGNIKVLPHVKVNGWENAWLLEEQPKPANQSLREPQRGYAKANGKMGRGWTYSTIYLLFWPQYLEYAGFGILALSLGILGVRQVRKMKTTP